MTAYSVPPLLAAIINCSIGLFVFYSNPRRKLNQIYLALSLCSVVWNVSVYSLFLYQEKYTALFWARSLQSGVIFLPPLLLHLINELLNRRSSKAQLATYVLACGFMIANVSGYLITSVRVLSYAGTVKHSYGEGGILYSAFVVYLASCITVIIHRLMVALRTTTGIRHQQIKYILLALGITFASGLHDMMPIISVHTYPLTNIPVYPFGSIGALGWAGIIAYAILKHRLMDIDVVIKKSVTYSALLLMLLIPCYALVIYGQETVFGRVDTRFTALVLGLLTAAAFIFPRLKTRTEQTIEQVLFKGKYDYRDTLARFSQELVSILQLDTLLDNTLQTLVRVMEITRATVYLYDEPQHGYRLEASVGEAPDHANHVLVLSDEQLIVDLREHPRALVTEELERRENNPQALAEGATLRRLDYEACIPLTTKRGLVGIVLLGKKRSGGIYSGEDLKLLATLGNQAAMAIENARLYENLKLQERATQRAERLASLGTLTAGLAHEIRNPLVSVKTFLQLLPERLNDTEFRTTFLEITTFEVERITRLLSQLLEFARPTEPKLHPEDVALIVRQMGLLARNEAIKHGISLDWTVPMDLPKVLLDAEQIKQVLQNLLMNAIQATPEGGRVQVDVRPARKAGAVQHVQIEVADSGSGIPEENLEKIFTPFFTTKEKGTGLGLAVAHRIIEDHGGTMEVTSQVGRGTTFVITLPLDPRNQPARAD